jgi:selenocysteine-specific elongation factor
MLRRAGDPNSEVADAPGLTLAVIGHVNHGKTALVRALTGMDTDRLREEVERGLSITLGFAWCGGPGGDLDVIDAPGHEDFIRAMVSGVTGARAILLVVSATEGFGRQTHEHLQIATLLGIRTGVVAVTKADLAPEEEGAALARIAADLRGSVLDGEPVVLCSAVSGRGLTDLRVALESLAVRTPQPPARRSPSRPASR